MQIWCRPEGIVLDPFAGTGTTAHAILDLNRETGANRRFILIEQGNTEKGDHYAKTLTVDRIRRAITGDWASGEREPLGGGFAELICGHDPRIESPHDMFETANIKPLEDKLQLA